MRAFNTLEYRKDKTKARYIRMRDITEGSENFEYMRLSDKRCILVFRMLLYMYIKCC